MELTQGVKRRRSLSFVDLSREESISPPPKRRSSPIREDHEDRDINHFAGRPEKRPPQGPHDGRYRPPGITIPSPMQLNFVAELPASSNVDTVSLGNLLGDPMIKECWLFNYLFDVDFVMEHLDPDVRNLVQVKIVHGSWKQDDQNRIQIDEAARRYPNIKVLRAYMPEMFGTHHSKMIVLFRHDDLAQVVVLTANFIERDWRMSQAIWKTPLLPLQETQQTTAPSDHTLGTGQRFKADLLAYFHSYGRSLLQNLTTQLQLHDFSTVIGALVASVPGKQMLGSISDDEMLWGWPSLKRILRSIPDSSTITTSTATQGPPQIIAQVSSIASIGEKYLTSTLFPTLSTLGPKPLTQSQCPTTKSTTAPTPKISIIFPTASEIRSSIDGYASGASIHMKTSTPTQQQQLAFLHPLLCHWATPSPLSTSLSPLRPTLDSPSLTHRKQSPLLQTHRSAHRPHLVPHIKTYTRFSTSTSTAQPTIDWALITSANLSTQAWGAAASAAGEVRICSYEVGVCVWPALWGKGARMLPVFGEGGEGEENGEGGRGGRSRDGEAAMQMHENEPSPSQPQDPATTPSPSQPTPTTTTKVANNPKSNPSPKDLVIGWRMPYDLPLTPYAKHEKPWCASEMCAVPDHLGRVWPGYGNG